MPTHFNRVLMVACNIKQQERAEAKFHIGTIFVMIVHYSYNMDKLHILHV